MHCITGFVYYFFFCSCFLFVPVVLVNDTRTEDTTATLLRGEYHKVEYEHHGLQLEEYEEHDNNSTSVEEIDSIEHTDSAEDSPHNLTKPKKHKEVDQGDSDVSEERNTEQFIGDSQSFGLKRVGAPASNSGSDQRPSEVISVIENAFNNRKTFSCPKTKVDFKTGTSIGDLSPEDISIIAAMGDALATGIGLWPQADIEFRGAAFPIGGDATIDGLITIPNILREFNPALAGVSHGMGSREQLPEYQLNIAATDATSSDMPNQAKELVRRLKKLTDYDYTREWVMVIITVGTQEVCNSCTGPNEEALRQAIDHLQAGIPKALVVLLGPIHVSSAYQQKANLLKTRCDCSRDQDESFMQDLSKQWISVFARLQEHVDDSPMQRSTFALVALPMLTITSRYPYSLFIANKPLLNRRGHNYATKWLWNRLIAGDKYNLSAAVLSVDNYFCPSMGCPYFRTSANAHLCQLLTNQEAKEKELALGSDGQVFKKPRRTQQRLYTIALVIVLIAFFVVITMGTLFYQRSKQGDHGRFEVVDDSQKKLEEAQKEEERNIINRQNSRVMSDVNQPLFNSKQSIRKPTANNVILEE